MTKNEYFFNQFSIILRGREISSCGKKLVPLSKYNVFVIIYVFFQLLGSQHDAGIPICGMIIKEN